MTPRIVHRLDTLDVFHRALALAAQVASVAKRPPFADHPKRRSQLERAAESIYANIAEGSASGSNRNYARYVQYAIASSSELESHLAFARRIRAITRAVHTALAGEAVEIRKMLIGLKKYLLRTPDE
jgi:four helix bundle protein